MRQAVGWIGNGIDRIDEPAVPAAGRVTAHRLNRAEYDNTVRDPLGLDLRSADRFPPDDSGHGFDTVAEALSPALMDAYLAAAETLGRRALFGPPEIEPTVVRHQPPPRWGLDGRCNARFLYKLPCTVLDCDVTGLSHPSALHATHLFPASAI